MGTSGKKKGGGFLVQGSILAMAGIITKVIGAIYRIPMLNIMGLEGQGYYSIAFQVYSLALIVSSYSLPLAVSKLVSARTAKRHYRNAHRVFKAALMFAFCVGSILALVIFLGAGFISGNIMESPASAYALRVLTPALIIVAVMGVLRGYFQGLGSMIPTAISQVLEQILNAIVSVLGAYVLMGYGEKLALQKNDASLGPAYSAAGGTLGTVAGALIGLVFLFVCYYAYKGVLNRKLRSDRSQRQEDYAFLFKVLLLTIAPVILSTTAYNIGHILSITVFNKVMAAQGMDAAVRAAELGKYDQFDTLFNVPVAVANSLGASMMPALVQAYANEDRKLLFSRIYMTVRFVMLIAIPSCFGFLTLGKALMDFIWPSIENTTQGYIMQLGAITIVFYSLTTIMNAVLQGIDRMMKPVKNAVISQVISLVVLFICLVMFKWNIYALVIGKIAFSFSMCILNYVDLHKACGYKQEMQRTFVIPAVAAAIMGITAYGTHFALNILVGGRISTLVAICLAVVVYVIGILKLGGLTEDEILAMPKGATLLHLLKKLHLIKEKRYY